MRISFDGTELVDCATHEVFRVPGLFNCLDCGASFRVEVGAPTEQVAEGNGACSEAHTIDDDFLASQS